MFDEFTRECLAIRVARRLNSYHVIETLGECMLTHGVPEHNRATRPVWLHLVEHSPGTIQPHFMSVERDLLQEARKHKENAAANTLNAGPVRRFLIPAPH